MKNVFTALVSTALICTLVLSFSACGTEPSSGKEIFTTEEVTYLKSKTPLGNSSESVLSYFNSTVNKIKTNIPAVSYCFSKNIPDDSIKFTKKGQKKSQKTDPSFEELNVSGEVIEKIILKDIKEYKGSVPTGKYSTDILLKKGENWRSDLKLSDIKSATVKEIDDEYYITVLLDDVYKNGDTSSIIKAFNLRDKNEILDSEEFKKVSANLEINNYSVYYNGCRVDLVVNRLTDEAESIKYYKSASVIAHLTGIGDYASLGEISVLFNLEDIADFKIN